MDNKGQSITGFARLVRWGATVALIVTIAVQLVAWGAASPHVRLHSLSGGDSRITLGVSAFHGIFVILALTQLLLLLRHVEKGELFSVGVTACLRRSALFMMVAILSAVVVAPLLESLFSSCTLGGDICDRRIPIDMRGIWMLLISTLFFLVARLLDEARRIDEDNRQII